MPPVAAPGLQLLHQDVQVVAIALHARQRVLAGRLENGGGRQGVEAHHHPAPDPHLALRHRPEQHLELFGMQGVDVVQDDQKLQPNPLAVAPGQFDVAQALEGLIRLVGGLRDRLHRRRDQAGADRVDRALHLPRAGQHALLVGAADRLQLGRGVFPKVQLDVAHGAAPMGG